MPERRLVTVGSEQPVPPRHVETEITVGLAPIYRVMHTMHVRRYHQEPKHAIETRRQPNVAMIEHGGGIQPDLENQHGDRRGAEQENRSQLDQHRDGNFAWMKPQSGCDIEFQVRMMHSMQPPKE